MPNFLSRKFLTIAGVIAVLLLIIGSRFVATGPAVTTAPQLYRPAIAGNAPIANVQIGQTTRQTIAKLPGAQQTTINGQPGYTVSHDATILPDEVILQNNVASFVQITLPAQIQTEGYANLQGYVAGYGQPERIFYGSKIYGPGFITYFYGSHGVAVTANRNTGEIYVLQLFTPLSASEYLKRYGQDVMNPTQDVGAGAE